MAEGGFRVLEPRCRRSKEVEVERWEPRHMNNWVLSVGKDDSARPTVGHAPKRRAPAVPAQCLVSRPSYLSPINMSPHGLAAAVSTSSCLAAQWSCHQQGLARAQTGPRSRAKWEQRSILTKPAYRRRRSPWRRSAAQRETQVVGPD